MNQHIITLHIQRTHLHKHSNPLVEVLTEVKNSLEQQSLADYVLEVADSFLAAPVVVGGSGPAHDDLAVVGHQVEH